SVKIVDGLGSRSERNRRLLGVPVRRHGYDGFGPRQLLAQRGQERARRHVLLEVEHGRAMGQEDSRHRHCFNPHTTCSIGKGRALFMVGMRSLVAFTLTIWALLGAPAMAQTTLRLVAHSDLKVLDPIWTTAFITRNHGYLVYDTLFAKDANKKVQPQMV